MATKEQNMILTLNRRLATLQRNDLTDSSVYRNYVARAQMAGMEVSTSARTGLTIIKAPKAVTDAMKDPNSKEANAIQSMFSLPTYTKLAKRAREYTAGEGSDFTIQTDKAGRKRSINAAIMAIDNLHDYINSHLSTLYTHMKEAGPELDLLHASRVRTYSELKQVTDKIRELEESDSDDTNSLLDYYLNREV